MDLKSNFIPFMSVADTYKFRSKLYKFVTSAAWRNLKRKEEPPDPLKGEGKQIPEARVQLPVSVESMACVTAHLLVITSRKGAKVFIGDSKSKRPDSFASQFIKLSFFAALREIIQSPETGGKDLHHAERERGRDGTRRLRARRLARYAPHCRLPLDAR